MPRLTPFVMVILTPTITIMLTLLLVTWLGPPIPTPLAVRVQAAHGQSQQGHGCSKGKKTKFHFGS